MRRGKKLGKAQEAKPSHECESKHPYTLSLRDRRFSTNFAKVPEVEMKFDCDNRKATTLDRQGQLSVTIPSRVYSRYALEATDMCTFEHS